MLKLDDLPFREIYYTIIRWELMDEFEQMQEDIDREYLEKYWEFDR